MFTFTSTFTDTFTDTFTNTFYNNPFANIFANTWHTSETVLRRGTMPAEEATAFTTIRKVMRKDVRKGVRRCVLEQNTQSIQNIQNI